MNFFGNMVRTHNTQNSGETLMSHVIGHHGAIEVVCGPMFSGKTEELIRRVKRAQIAKQRVQIFKPAIDVRYDETKVVSHSSQEIHSEPVESSIEILMKLKDHTRIVAIDEVQFFDEDIVKVVTKLANRGYRVICAGLDLDYRGIPFGPMPMLLALADNVQKIQAICTVCGAPATRSQRLSDSTDTVLLGETDKYEARCRAHYFYEPDEEQAILPIKEEVSSISEGLIN
jgi:thymidine kinase